jgi:hypothetical protein
MNPLAVAQSLCKFGLFESKNHNRCNSTTANYAPRGAARARLKAQLRRGLFHLNRVLAW